MSEEQKRSRSQEVIDELIRISIEEKEEKEAKIIELKKDVETKYYGLKKPLIIEARDCLIKEGFQKKKVTVEIVRKLEGYISESYIRKCIDDPELKDESKIRKQIELTTDGEQIESSDGDEGNNENSSEAARAEYERNKYYRNMPSIKNTTMQPNVASSSVRTNDLNEQIGSDIETQRTIRELKQKIDTMETERSMHTTVIINKNIFDELTGFIEDKKVKRIYLDFDENYTVTKARVEV